MPKAKTKVRAASSRAKRKSATTSTQPTLQEIQLRAYQIYLERRGAPGNELEDWVRAERELVEQEPVKSPASDNRPSRKSVPRKSLVEAGEQTNGAQAA